MWTLYRTSKQRRDQDTGRSASERRALRPAPDRLETREVLSTLAHSSHVNAAAAASAARAFANTHVLQNSFARATSLASTARMNVAATAIRLSTGSAARLSPNLLLNSLRTGGTNTNTFAQTLPTNAFGVSSGLQFTNGLGFANPAGRLGLTNNATNGLLFGNGLGQTTPVSLQNSNLTTTNGLAFTNGLGFTSPLAQQQNNNAATSGLAFTNGQGFASPSGQNTFFNSTTNGLQFTNGLGFNNPNNNPFVNTSAVSGFGSGAGISATSGGLGAAATLGGIFGRLGTTGTTTF